VLIVGYSGSEQARVRGSTRIKVQRVSSIANKNSIRSLCAKPEHSVWFLCDVQISSPVTLQGNLVRHAGKCWSRRAAAWWLSFSQGTKDGGFVSGCEGPTDSFLSGKFPNPFSYEVLQVRLHSQSRTTVHGDLSALMDTSTDCRNNNCPGT
jgi:hypothetical protein